MSRPSDGNRAARKALDRAHLSQASPAAQTIKLADLLDNCPDICQHDEKFGRIFLAEASALLEVLGSGDPRLRERCRKTVGEWAGRLDVGGPARLEEHDHEEAAGIPVPLEARDALAEMFTSAFRARHIARPLPSFDADRPPAALAAELDGLHLTLAGVRVQGMVRGYVRREDLGAAAGPAAPMREFRPGQVLPAAASLADVIHVLTRHEHCFVATLGGVVATITRAEIQSPLVRMWLFGMLTLFEMAVVQRIQSRWPEGGWDEQVAPARLEKARALRAERQRRGQECSLLDCLQFSDKALVALDDPTYVEEFGFASKGAAQRVVKDLESLRNNLAHSQDIVLHDWPQIARLARRMQGLGARRRDAAVAPDPAKTAR